MSGSATVILGCVGEPSFSTTSLVKRTIEKNRIAVNVCCDAVGRKSLELPNAPKPITGVSDSVSDSRRRGSEVDVGQGDCEPSSEPYLSVFKHEVFERELAGFGLSEYLGIRTAGTYERRYKCSVLISEPDARGVAGYDRGASV